MEDLLFGEGRVGLFTYKDLQKLLCVNKKFFEMIKLDLELRDLWCCSKCHGNNNMKFCICEKNICFRCSLQCDKCDSHLCIDCIHTCMNCYQELCVLCKHEIHYCLFCPTKIFDCENIAPTCFLHEIYVCFACSYDCFDIDCPECE